MIQKQKTWSQFIVETALPEGFRASLGEAIECEAFIPPLSPASLDQRSGWVLPDNMLSTDFGNQDAWLFNQYVVLALRIDQKKLPAKLYAATVKSRCAAWCAAQSRAKCPAAVKLEITEQVKLEMAPNVLPTTSLVWAVWNINDGGVVVFTHAEGALDTFRKKFRRTFSVGLTPDELNRNYVEEEAHPAWYCKTFLRWLWHRGEEASFVGRSWWVSNRIVMQGPNDEKPTIVLSGDNGHRGQAAKAATLANYSPSSLRLWVRSDDREYEFTLTDDLRIAGAKLPALVKTGEAAEILYERMYLIEDLDSHLREMFAEFEYIHKDQELRASFEKAVVDWAQEQE